MIDLKKFSQDDPYRIQQLRLMDDDFMSKCFEDISCVQLVINILLERDDLTVQSVHTQHNIKNLQGRSIIMDIYATDQDGRQLNIEIQRADRGAGHKRARYHSSMLDANLLSPGDDYSKLPETYVIFITERDVLGKNLPLYHIDRCIAETGECFEDEAHILYVNGAYQGEDPIGLLMHDLRCTDPSDMHYETLANRTHHFKEDEKGVVTMCRLLEEMRNEVAAEVAAQVTAEVTAKVTAEVTAEVAADVTTDLARKFLASGKHTHEEIAEITGLSLETVNKLATEK